jgi:hypothetical protein
MADVQAPRAPDDAPQELKDFLDCTGTVLRWQPGPVSWLGLPVDPVIEFEPGQGPGAINLKITIGSPPFGVSFSLPASVNAAGELSIDTAKIPDGVPGKEGLDQWIRDLNAWFRQNGRKLKPAVLTGGAITLEKTAIGATAVAPAVVPVRPRPTTSPAPKPAPTPAPTGAKAEDKSGQSIGCMSMYLLAAVLVLGAFGAVALGIIDLDGPSPAGQATSTPAATASAQPTGLPTGQPTPQATPSPTPLPPSPKTGVSIVCVRVVHQQLQEFVSYLDWFMWWTGAEIDYFELTVLGAGNDAPVRLEYDQQQGAWQADLGLKQAGEKSITRLVAHLTNGTTIDVTADLIAAFGKDTFTVRYPQEDSFGDCPG